MFRLILNNKVKDYKHSDLCLHLLAYEAKMLNIDILKHYQSYNYDLDSIDMANLKRLNKLLDNKDFKEYRLKYNLFKEAKNKYQNDISYSLLTKKLNKVEYALILDYLYQDEVFEASLKYIFKELDKYKSELYRLISLIDDRYLTMSINLIVDNEMTIKVLNQMGIYKINDLKKLEIDLLLIIFSRDLNDILKVLSELGYVESDLLETEILKVSNYLKSKNILFEVISKRYAFYSDKQTLEEIAISHNLTRERVRQLENKAKNYLLENKELAIYLEAYLDELFIDKEVLFISDIKDIDLEYIGFMKVICDIFNLKYKYSNEYDLFYISGYLEVVINNILNEMPLIITFEQYNKLDSFRAKIVDNYYHLRKNKYLKNGVNLADIYSYVVDTLYPNGFSYDDSNLISVNEMLKKDFELEEVTMHNLQSSLVRIGYSNIDKGVLINPKFSVELDDKLIDDILNYLTKFDDIVFYHTIYDEFKTRLNNIGINNRYYLKGVLDPHIKDIYQTKRDYIKIDANKSSNEAIINVINSFDGLFTLSDLKAKFPGLTTNVFMTIIYNLEDVLWYDYGKKFVKIEDIKLTDKDIAIIKDGICLLLSQNDMGFITSYNLYALIKDDLTCKYIDNHFILFSLVKAIFKDDYNYSRPFIYINDNKLNYSNIILNYLYSLDTFDNEVVSHYTSSYKLKGIGNYLGLMINVSEDFVQINIDTCIKKKLLNLSEEELNLIDEVLELTIKDNKQIDFKNYNIFMNLPTLKYRWNKYLLVGIIRSYLNHKYLITYTTNMYNTTSFIIRRR